MKPMPSSDVLEAAKELSGLLTPDPYSGLKYRVLCPECGGLGWTTPRNHDDPKACPCVCKGSGLHPDVRKARDRLRSALSEGSP